MVGLWVAVLDTDTSKKRTTAMTRKDYLEAIGSLIKGVTIISLNAYFAFSKHEANLPRTAFIAIQKSGERVSQEMSTFTQIVPRTSEQHLQLLACTLDAVKHCELVFGAVDATLTDGADKEACEKGLNALREATEFIQVLAEIEVPN